MALTRVTKTGNITVDTITSDNNVGIGATASDLYTGHSNLQIGAQAILGANKTISSTGQTYLSHNLRYNTGGLYRVHNNSVANEGVIYQQYDGNHVFSNSAATTDTGNINVIERMRINENGIITKSSQPCFSAILGSHVNASNYLTGWTAQTNVGSHFNAGTGTFTAPVTGEYYFYVSVMRSTNDSGDYSVQIKKNSSTVRLSNDMVNGAYVTYMQTTVPCILSLAGNDAVRFYVGNTAGVTTSYAYQGTYTHCAGYLLG